MPSGVSAATTVSRISPRCRRTSGFDDDGVGKVIVDAAPCIAEDEERVDEAVERDQPKESVHEIAPDDDPRDGHFRAVGAQEFDPAGLLADRLPVLPEKLDGDPEPRNQADGGQRDPNPHAGAKVVSARRSGGRETGDGCDNQRHIDEQTENQPVEDAGAQPRAAIGELNAYRGVDDILNDSLRRRVRICHAWAWFVMGSVRGEGCRCILHRYSASSPTVFVRCAPNLQASFPPPCLPQNLTPNVKFACRPPRSSLSPVNKSRGKPCASTFCQRNSPPTVQLPIGARTPPKIVGPAAVPSFTNLAGKIVNVSSMNSPTSLY